jgi:hypothetical protein
VKQRDRAMGKVACTLNLSRTDKQYELSCEYDGENLKATTVSDEELYKLFSNPESELESSLTFLIQEIMVKLLEYTVTTIQINKESVTVICHRKIIQHLGNLERALKDREERIKILENRINQMIGL